MAESLSGASVEALSELVVTVREPSEAEIEAAREASAERFTPPQPDNLLGRHVVIAMLRAAYAVQFHEHVMDDWARAVLGLPIVVPKKTL